VLPGFSLPAMIRLTCPSCETIVAVAESQKGTEVKCPRCHGMVHVPEMADTEGFDGRSGATDLPRFRYAMEQISPTLELPTGRAEVEDAADYLEKVVARWGEKGWEFYRVDTIGVRIPSGCILGLLGYPPIDRLYYVVTFRKEV
jgi:predicted Zn finger-like uncharacterized protein